MKINHFDQCCPICLSRCQFLRRFLCGAAVEPHTTVPPSTAVTAAAIAAGSNRIAPRSIAAKTMPPPAMAMREARMNLRQFSILAASSSMWASRRTISSCGSPPLLWTRKVERRQEEASPNGVGEQLAQEPAPAEDEAPKSPDNHADPFGQMLRELVQNEPSPNGVGEQLRQEPAPAEDETPKGPDGNAMHPLRQVFAIANEVFGQRAIEDDQGFRNVGERQIRRPMGRSLP